MRKTQKIEVGTYQDKVGFTMYFETGEKEHFLFSLDVASALANGLLKVIEDLKYIDSQFKSPGDCIRISDYSDVKIMPPKEE